MERQAAQLLSLVVRAATPLERANALIALGDLLTGEGSWTPGGGLSGGRLHQQYEQQLHQQQMQVAPRFFPAVLEFQTHRETETRVAVVYVLEMFCELDMKSFLPQVTEAWLKRLIRDHEVEVSKATFRVVTRLYQKVLKYACAPNVYASFPRDLWESWTQLIRITCDSVRTDSVGVQTLVVKFLETVVISFSKPEQGISTRSETFHLKEIPPAHPVISAAILQAEGRRSMETLLALARTKSAREKLPRRTLHAIMNALCAIFRRRPRNSTESVLRLLRDYTCDEMKKEKKDRATEFLMRSIFLNIFKTPAARAPELREFLKEAVSLLDLESQAASIMRHVDRQYAGIPLTSLLASSPKKLETRDLEDKPQAPVSDAQNNLPTVDQATSMTSAMIAGIPPTDILQLVLVNLANAPRSLNDILAQRVEKRKFSGGKPTDPRKRHHLAAQLDETILPTRNEANMVSVGFSSLSLSLEREADNLYLQASSGVSSGWLDSSIVEGHTNRAAVKSMKRLSSVRTVAPKVTKPRLSDESISALLSMTIRRMLSSSKAAESAGASNLRYILVSLLLSCADDQTRATSVEEICNGFEENAELVAFWLTKEVSVEVRYPDAQLERTLADVNDNQTATGGVNGDESLKEVPEGKSRYESLLNAFVDRICSGENLEEMEKRLARILSDAPIVTDTTYRQLMEKCEDSVSTLLGLSVFRTLIFERPGPSIRLLASELYVHFQSTPVSSRIQDFAISTISHSVMDTGDGPFESRAQLFLAICAKNNSLLWKLGDIYNEAKEGELEVLREQLKDLAKNLSRQSPSLLEFVRGNDTTMNTDALVLDLIKSIPTEGTAKAGDDPLVAAVLDRFRSTQDPRVLVPIVGSLDRETVTSLLSHLVSVPKEEGGFRSVLKNLTAAKHMSLSPTDLLVELHLIDPDLSGKVQRTLIFESTQACFESKVVFNQEAVANALTRLVEMTPIPSLFMRSVIQTLNFHPKLQGHVLSLLRRLIEKEVWTSKDLWDGFLLCSQKTLPRSAKVLLSLPPTQLQDALNRSAPLRDALRKAVAQSRSAIPGWLSSIIHNAAP